MEQRTIQTQESAERIDALLARSLPELTRSAAQRLLAQGAVTKDGAPVKKNYKTAPGDTFVVTLPDAAPSFKTSCLHQPLEGFSASIHSTPLVV